VVKNITPGNEENSNTRSSRQPAKVLFCNHVDRRLGHGGGPLSPCAKKPNKRGREKEPSGFGCCKLRDDIINRGGLKQINRGDTSRPKQLGGAIMGGGPEKRRLTEEINAA